MTPPLSQLTQELMERIRFAALKLSQGNVPTLLEAIDPARRDWRVC